jgi:serine/threonine protein kinase/tetratricopeptide (TPR) repeat protein
LKCGCCTIPAVDPRVRLLFHELIDLRPEERQRALGGREVTPDVRTELESLLDFDSASAGHLTESISEVSSDLLRSLASAEIRRCGPYRLVRLLGRGGMGEVYLGERADGEIQQTVAVKLLTAEGHRPGWRERFLKERQLLASLNHPSIVHVIDAGHIEDGRPYLVMEYVEGVSIDLHSAALEVEERLRLFLSVCEGVSHAHRRLIIHRDLKPSNILVDASGQPKLLDFGIAKLLDESGDANQTAERLLTPNYTSPEQFRGGGQTTATDVYSLGAVLYKMLTGRSPHESDTGGSQIVEIIAGVREIPEASRLNRRLSADLDLILGKALRMEVEDRYVSVDAFASDIRAFLESRPIEARAGDAWYRLCKFLRRRWVPVVAATVMIASLSAGLYVANRERLIAEQRFAQLRRLSNEVFDLDISIRDLPGSTQARQKLVSASLQYLEGLAAAARGDLDLSEEIGQGYWRVGRIQGVPVELNLGERDKAEASLRTADEFTDRVLAIRSNDRDALYLSAAIANDRMILAEEEHRYEDALALANKSALRLEAFLARGDIQDAERAGAALRFGNIALAHMNMHFYVEAIPYAEREVELARTIPSPRPAVDFGMVPVAKAMSQGDLEGALDAFEQSRMAAERALYRTEARRKNDLYGIFFREGLILGGEDDVNLGRPADAIQAFQKALDLAEEVAREDPKNVTTQVQSARAEVALANIVRHRSPRQALTLYDVALGRLSGTRSSLPTQRDRALALANSAYAVRSLGRVSEARQRIDAALEILKETHDYPAEQYYLDGAVYVVLLDLADHEAAVGELSRAIESCEQLAEKTVAGRTSARRDLSDAVRLSRLEAALGYLYRKTGEAEKEKAAEARLAELWQDWNRKLPDNGLVRSQMEAARR